MSTRYTKVAQVERGPGDRWEFGIYGRIRPGPVNFLPRLPFFLRSRYNRSAGRNASAAARVAKLADARDLKSRVP